MYDMPPFLVCFRSFPGFGFLYLLHPSFPEMGCILFFYLASEYSLPKPHATQFWSLRKPKVVHNCFLLATICPEYVSYIPG